MKFGRPVQLNWIYTYIAAMGTDVFKEFQSHYSISPRRLKAVSPVLDNSTFLLRFYPVCAFLQLTTHVEMTMVAVNRSASSATEQITMVWVTAANADLALTWTWTAATASVMSWPLSLPDWRPGGMYCSWTGPAPVLLLHREGAFLSIGWSFPLLVPYFSVIF